jgi:DNA-binding NtrC family response regulator
MDLIHKIDKIYKIDKNKIKSDTKNKYPEIASIDEKNRIEIKIMLMDDDPTYRKIVERFCEKRNISLIMCKNFKELKEKWVSDRPTFVIIDFDLDENLTGPDVAKLMGWTPVMLISRKISWIPPQYAWSKNIVEFFHKKYGVSKMIDRAIELAEAS